MKFILIGLLLIWLLFYSIFGLGGVVFGIALVTIVWGVISIHLDK